MLDLLPKIFKPAARYLTFRFIIAITSLIIVAGILLMLVYTMLVSSVIEQSYMQQENLFSEQVSANMHAYLDHAYTVLMADYNAGRTADPVLSKYLDVGIVQNRNNKIYSLNFEDQKFIALAAFADTIDPSTPVFSLDAKNNIIYITYQGSTGYEVGGIDLKGGQIASIISSTTFHTYLVTNNGAIILTNTAKVQNNFFSSLKLQYNDFVQMKIGNVRREIFTYTPLQDVPLGIGILSDPVTSVSAQYAQPYLFYIVLIGIILFLALVAIYSILVDIPLTRLLSFFEDYNKGKAGSIHVYTQDSFGLLSENINNLIGKVKNDFQRIHKADQIQNDFLLLSGHLLRTPITSIQGYLDLLQSTNKDESLNGTIADIRRTLDKLIQLEENILAISQENDKIISAPEETILARDIVQTTFDQMQPAAKAKNITLLADTAALQEAAVKANRENLTRALKNFVDNGIKFTAEGGTVKIYGQVRDNIVILSVSDTGIGLTKDEVAQLFKKFSKISDTMEYNSDGLGLGLYVTKLVAERYNGSVSVDSIKGSGSIFNIQLPLA